MMGARLLVILLACIAAVCAQPVVITSLPTTTAAINVPVRTPQFYLVTGRPSAGMGLAFNFSVSGVTDDGIKDIMITYALHDFSCIVDADDDGDSSSCQTDASSPFSCEYTASGSGPRQCTFSIPACLAQNDVFIAIGSGRLPLTVRLTVRESDVPVQELQLVTGTNKWIRGDMAAEGEDVSALWRLDVGAITRGKTIKLTGTSTFGGITGASTPAAPAPGTVCPYAGMVGARELMEANMFGGGDYYDFLGSADRHQSYLTQIRSHTKAFNFTVSVADTVCANAGLDVCGRHVTYSHVALKDITSNVEAAATLISLLGPEKLGSRCTTLVVELMCKLGIPRCGTDNFVPPRCAPVCYADALAKLQDACGDNFAPPTATGTKTNGARDVVDASPAHAMLRRVVDRLSAPAPALGAADTCIGCAEIELIGAAPSITVMLGLVLAALMLFF